MLRPTNGMKERRVGDLKLRDSPDTGLSYTARTGGLPARRQGVLVIRPPDRLGRRSVSSRPVGRVESKYNAIISLSA